MGHLKNLEITKESEFVPEQETTMKQPEIPKIAPRETKVWGQEVFGKKPELTDEQLALIAELHKPEQDAAMDKSICPICNKKMAGEIHNAEPVVDGFCCDACNTTVVIPTRLVAAKLKRCWT